VSNRISKSNTECCANSPLDTSSIPTNPNYFPNPQLRRTRLRSLHRHRIQGPAHPWAECAAQRRDFDLRRWVLMKMRLGWRWRWRRWILITIIFCIETYADSLIRFFADEIVKSIVWK